jgi:hypothetical protein
VSGPQDDGQNVQQFMTDSPWPAQVVIQQVQLEIRATPSLSQGGVLLLDESADEKAGPNSAGAGRQHSGRLGKVEMSRVGVEHCARRCISGVPGLAEVRAPLCGLQATMPLPQLSPEQATQLVVKHLVNRPRSHQSRLRAQRKARGPT